MPYDLGDVATLTTEIRDANGVLANAGAVVLTVTLPDLTTVTPAVTNPSTGNYRSDYTPLVSGLYRVRWVATGLNASATTDAFDVRQTTPLLIFSLSHAKTMLPKVADADNEKLRNLIESTTSIVEYIVGPVAVRSVSEVVRGSGRQSYFVLRETPVVSIQSITPIIIGNITYPVANYDIDSPTGIVQEKRGRGFVGTHRVVYTAGMTVIPAAIRDAAAMTLRYLWSFQLGPHSGPRDRTQPVPGLGRELPVQVVELLRPYAKAGGWA